MIDVDFSLALHNRTGKYFLGRDIIDALGQRVDRVIYARGTALPQSAAMRRLLGRVELWERMLRVDRPALARLLPPLRRANRTLHLDPITAISHRIEARDIVLCHDIGPVTHPEFFDARIVRAYRCAYRKIRDAGCHMVFVSDTARRAFHTAFGDGFASATVIPIPTRPQMATAVPRRPGGVPDRYFLTVGSLGARKNQALTIEAFARSGLGAEGVGYVMTGPNEPGAEAVVAAAERVPGVHILGYVADEELVWLYRHAIGFVLMSQLEGFGMPVVEATCHGLPCLVTRGGTLAEIGGPAMLQAAADDPDEIAAGLHALAGMTPADRDRRIAEAARFAQRYDRAPILRAWCDLIDAIEARCPYEGNRRHIVSKRPFVPAGPARYRRDRSGSETDNASQRMKD